VSVVRVLVFRFRFMGSSVGSLVEQPGPRR
jgi:hypothetical protein